MARHHRRAREPEEVEVAFKFGLIFILILVLVVGGFVGLGKFFSSPGNMVVTLGSIALAIPVLWFAGRAIYRHSAMARTRPIITRPPGWTPPVFPYNHPFGTQSPLPPAPVWTPANILPALDDIDWFQFERFCAALLRTAGCEVVRKGGAQPDGGVDLIAESGGERTLVQCKPWRSWVVQEKTVRDLLGSMTHFQVTRGALYTLQGWTKPAAVFAGHHAITLVDGVELARRASTQLTAKQLTEVLDSSVHHCPKCDAPMIWREGRFQSFWGCTTFPRCRGVLKHSGAR